MSYDWLYKPLSCWKLVHIAQPVASQFVIRFLWTAKKGGLWVQTRVRSHSFIDYVLLSLIQKGQLSVADENTNAYQVLVNPLLPSVCRLPITYANSLDQDQARHNVGPDLDPNCLTLRWYSVKKSKKMILIKISRWQKNMQNYPGGKEST